MTKWSINGKVVDAEDVPEYLDSYEFDFVKDDFEEGFNRSNTAAAVLFDYAGEDAYHEEFRRWVRDKLRHDPSYLERIKGVSRVSASGKSPAKARGKTTPVSRSPKLRYFKAGMSPDDMAEVIAEELTRCGLDKEYDPSWDVFDDCYWYMSTGERADFVEWANEVRPKCPKAAAMIEEAIAIFDDDGSFEAQADLYKKLSTMSSPASGRRKAPKGRGSTGKAGAKPTGRSAPRSNACKGRTPKKATTPKKGKGARK